MSLAPNWWRCDLAAGDMELFSPSSTVSPAAAASATATAEIADRVSNEQLPEDLKARLAQVDPLCMDLKEEKEVAKKHKREEIKAEKSKKRQMRLLKQLS